MLCAHLLLHAAIGLVAIGYVWWVLGPSQESCLGPPATATTLYRCQLGVFSAVTGACEIGSTFSP